MEELPLGACRVRGWSTGCELCWKGGKLVLFITGKCPLYETCPYCTILDYRRNKDVIYANERLVREDEDVVREAELTSALGAGITGGEPSLVPEKVAHYVRLLKERLGREFHVHMYTNALGVDERALRILAEAGLDEMRFHTWNRRLWERMRLALDFGLRVGAEMPAIPTKSHVRQLRELASYLDKIGAEFMNLNELEFTPANRERLLAMGFRPKEDSEVAVEGSAEVAREVLEFIERETSIMGYFCPALQKDYQVRMRWIRRAENVARDYEIPTDQGTLIYGIVEGPREVLMYLAGKYGGTMERDRLLMDPESFERSVEELLDLDLKARLVEVMPTDDRKELQVYPLEFVLRSRKDERGD